jgi:ribose transport system ATP-binding protein
MKNINKSFFGTRVLKDVNFSVRPGEIHALAGQKWRRKINVDEDSPRRLQHGFGRNYRSWIPVEIHSFQDAQRYGIGMVFQEFSLIP